MFWKYLRLLLKITCQPIWIFSDLCSRTLSIINHNLLNKKPSNYRKFLYSWATWWRWWWWWWLLWGIFLGHQELFVMVAAVLHAEKAASFQFPNEWLRIVGGREALPLGKITPTLHSAAKSCSAEAGLRPAKGGRPLCSQRAPGLLTDSLVCTACNQS